MIGGAFAFNNGDFLNILLYLDGEISKRINERRIKIGLTPLENLHITILTLQINRDNKDSIIFDNRYFYEYIKKKFIKYIIKTDIIFKSNYNEYDFFGKITNQYWVRQYRLDDYSCIRKFRKSIYNLFNKVLNNMTFKEKTMGIGNDIETFMIYSFNGQELYAISKDKYYGVNIWKPHVSIFKINDLNNNIKQQLVNKTNDEKIIILKKNIGKVKPISKININNDIKYLIISLSKSKKQQEYTRHNLGL
jgi:hypothetical protein